MWGQGQLGLIVVQERREFRGGNADNQCITVLQQLSHIFIYEMLTVWAAGCIFVKLYLINLTNSV